MRVQNAKLVKFCSKQESVYIRNLKRITDEEVDTLLKMVKDYGKDFDYISSEMRAKFPKPIFQPVFCRSLYLRYSNNFNWEQMDPEEFSTVFQNYKLGMLNHRRHIWRKMSILFKKRPMESLICRFREGTNHLFRDLICIYAVDDKKAFCNHILFGTIQDIIRMTTLSQVTVQMLLYLSEYNLSDYEKQDKVFWDMSVACTKMTKWMEIFIRIRFSKKVDYKYFLRENILDQIPEITIEDFSNTVERIMLLDTLNRVALSQSPYNDQYSHRIPKIIEGEIEKENSDCLEIEERPVFVPYGTHQCIFKTLDIRRNAQNRTSLPEYYNDKDRNVKRKKYFFSLTYKQKKLILNSETMIRMLPIVMKLDQLSNT